MMLDECVDTLHFLQSIAELEYAKKMTDVGHMRYAGADAELHKLSKEVSQHAYELVEKQYRVANDRKTKYSTQEIQPHMVEMFVQPASIILISGYVRCNASAGRIMRVTNQEYRYRYTDVSLFVYLHVNGAAALSTCDLLASTCR